MRRAWIFVLSASLFAGCINDGPPSAFPDATESEQDAGSDQDAGFFPDATPTADAGFFPDATPAADAGFFPDATPGPGYAHVAPPAGPVAAVLTSSTWVSHYQRDVKPFWLMSEAFGAPEGNFPSYRGMNGTLQQPSTRYPRMIARQTYGYSMGYLLTGEPRLLELAHAGMEWLRTHARDPRGGCHAQLSEAGAPIEGPKTAQDTAYCALGFAAYYFVTRDPAAEAELLSLRDTLFDPATFWDAANHRIRDGRSADLSAEVDVEGDGGWELVAQLDAINGFLLLSQPVMSTETRRTQLLGDLRTLSQTLLDHFLADGIFWGVSNAKGRFRTKHVDFGHNLKSYWMLLQVDKRLADHPFQAFVAEHVHAWLDLAYDSVTGRWGKRPLSLTTAEYGSDWWIYAELDQLSATLDLLGGARYFEKRTQTQQHWLTEFVDTRRPARELISSIHRDGSPAYPWTDTDTSKCNEWKSSFHSTEHALVLAILGHWAEDTEVELHFAVPEADSTTFIAKPYVFDGSERGRMSDEALTISGRTLRHVRVRFGDLY